MRRYIQSLDGIRGFGIFFVLLYHFLRLNGADWSVMGFAWIWIQMFFVQSGFLITEILLEKKNRGFKEYITTFYWRRILRIFPVYFAYVFLFLVVYIIWHRPDDFIERLPYLLTFTYNYTRLISELDFNSIWFIHFWSIAVEEQFYFVWPVIVYFLDKKRLQWLILFSIVLTPVLRYWLGIHFLDEGYSREMTGEIIYAFTLSQFDAFSIGAAIPLFGLREKIKHPLKWTSLTLIVLLIIGAINFLAVSKNHPNLSFSSLGISVAMIENMQHVWSYSLVNFLFLFVILYLIGKDYNGFFNSVFLVRIGKVVYGMYIFHFVILYIFASINTRYINNFYLSYVLAFLMSYLVAHLSYTYYEKKFLELK